MDNLRGALIMVLSMLGFAIEDMFIKLIGTDIPIGQIIFMLGTGGALCYGAMVVMKGEPLMDRAMLTRPILLRAGLFAIAGACLGALLARVASGAELPAIAWSTALAGKMLYGGVLGALVATLALRPLLATATVSTRKMH